MQTFNRTSGWDLLSLEHPKEPLESREIPKHRRARVLDEERVPQTEQQGQDQHCPADMQFKLSCLCVYLSLALSLSVSLSLTLSHALVNLYISISLYALATSYCSRGLPGGGLVGLLH